MNNVTHKVFLKGLLVISCAYPGNYFLFPNLIVNKSMVKIRI